MDSALHCKLDRASSAVHSSFPPQETNDIQDDVIGGYLHGKLCWLAKGACLKIHNHGSRSSSFSQTFVHYNDELALKVTTCKQYDSNILLIGLRTEEEKGLVYVFSLICNKVIKSIELPYPVTCLEVVLHEGGAITSSKVFAQNLRWLFGVAAVGTEGGHLYLLDLRLDDKIAYSSLPSKIEAVPTVIHNVPSVRDTVHKRSAHIAFELLDSCFEGNNFHYTAPDDQILETVDCSDVSITALQFEQRTLSLLVGYSFGQFQIFDLTDLTLCFSSLHDDMNTEVINFAFQEPENDPRNCCYVWVIRAPNDDESMETAPLTATMHQLVYQKKEIVEQNNRLTSVYQGLENCATQYELVMDNSLGLSPESGKSTLFQCSTIETYPPPHQYSDEESEYCSTPYTSLFVVGWRSYTSVASSTHVLVFDINSWYNAHMPTGYRGYGEDMTYIAIWEMDSVLSPSASRNLLAFSTPESSLQHFKTKTQPVPEQFSRPSAFSIVAYVLTSEETLTLQMHGIQRQVILYMMEEKSVKNCLVEPSDTFDQMVQVGLIDDIGISSLTLERKREKILNAALDHSFFGFITRVVVDVATGEYASSGCTLRFVMEWAWRNVAIIKDSFDQLCVPIFDCSTITLDSSLHAQLFKYQRHLGDLAHIFKILLREAAESSEQSVVEIEMKHKVVQLIHGYIKVLRWFIEARLLPEQVDGHVCAELQSHPEFHYVYERKALQSMFERRRRELKSHSKTSRECHLIIDGIVGDAGAGLKENWTKMGGDGASGLYPPPSIMALLDMYYLDGVDVELKHTIVTYFLLDVLAMVEDSEGESDCDDNYKQSKIYHREIVSFFPSTFQLANGTTNLIKAFWLLDHKEFHESVALFCDAGTETAPMAWQHRQILLACIMQGHCDLALKYLLNKHPASQSAEDVKLMIEIYTKNGLPQHALQVAQASSDPTSVESIYFHLFSCCHDNHLLNTLLELPVSDAEDALVSRYLQSGNIPNSHYLLVLYHLKKSRYSQAIKAYQQNKHSHMMAERDEAFKQQHETLKHVIQGFLNILPEVEREITCSGNKAFEQSKHMRKEVVQSKPLSAALNSRSTKVPLSHAALFAMSFQRERAEQSRPSETPFRKRTSKSVLTSGAGQTGKILFSSDIADSSAVKTPARKSFGRRSRSSFGGGGDSPLFTRYSRLSSAQVTSPVFAASQKDKRKSSLSGMASLLLQTPPITRKLPRSASRDQDFDMMTPQSILKVKLLKAKSPSLPSIPQHSTTSSNVGNESGSLTSLSRIGRDSEGSPARSQLPESSARHPTDNSCKKPLPDIPPVFAITTPTAGTNLLKGRSFKDYMQCNGSACTEASKGEADEKNNGSSCRKNISGLLSAVPTPSVDRTTFTGIRLNETKSTPFTPKKLRFFGVAASPNVEEEPEQSTSPPQRIAKDNIVVVRSANEDLDVDVTGDVTDDVNFNDEYRMDMEETAPVVEDAKADDGDTSPFAVAEDVFPRQEATEVATTSSEYEVLAKQPDALEEPATSADDFALEMSCSEEEEQSHEKDDAGKEDIPTPVEEQGGAVALDNQVKVGEELQVAAQAETEDFNLKLSVSEGEVLSMEEDIANPEAEIEAPGANIPEYLLETESVLPAANLVEKGEDVAATEQVESDEIDLKLDSSGSDEGLSPALSSPLEVAQDVTDGVMNESEKWDVLLSRKTIADGAVATEEVTTAGEKGDLSKEEVDIKATWDVGVADVTTAEAKPVGESVTMQDEQKIEATLVGNKPIQTPTTARLFNETVFLLSPPTTRGRKSKVAFVKEDPGTPEPQFVLSPAATRTRSTRKRPVQVKQEATTPAKKSRLASSERQEEDLETKPVPASAKKGRKSPSRKAAPLTPSRSSARVKARMSEIDSSPTHKTKPQQQNVEPEPSASDEPHSMEPPTTTRTSSRSRRARTPSRNEQAEEKHATRQSARKASAASDVKEPQKSDSSDAEAQQPTKTPSKRRKIASMDLPAQPPDGEPPTVARTPSRRRTRASENHTAVAEPESEAPVVTRTASKTRGKGKRSQDAAAPHVAEETASEPAPPSVTRAGSKTRSQRKVKPAPDELRVVEEDTEDAPTVTRTASKRRSKARIAAESDNNEGMHEPPAVTRTSSRRRAAKEQHGEVKDEVPTVTRTSSRRRKTEEVAEQEEPPHVTRSSSRRARKQVSESEDHYPPPSVTRTSSRRRTAKSSETETEEPPPAVVKTASRGSRGSRKKIVEQEEEPPTVTRSPSKTRGKISAPDPNQHPVATRTSSRSKQVKVMQEETILSDIVEEEVARGSSSPSDDDVALIAMPAKGNTPSRKPTTSKLPEAKSGAAPFPIVARRRAKVFIRKKIT